MLGQSAFAAPVSSLSSATGNGAQLQPRYCSVVRTVLPTERVNVATPVRRRAVHRARIIAVESGHQQGDSAQSVDIFRETPARLIGYTNECGEALRFFIGAQGVALTYGVAFSYVCADAVYQAVRRGTRAQGKVSPTRLKSAIALDTLIWQTLASVVFPGFTINRIVFFSEHAMAAGNDMLLENHMSVVSTAAVHSTCTVVGLCAIPLIVKPIDLLAHYLMDHAVRPWLLNPALHIHFDADSPELDD